MKRFMWRSASPAVFVFIRFCVKWTKERVKGMSYQSESTVCTESATAV
jgi:hypothetical protein